MTMTPLKKRNLNLSLHEMRGGVFTRGRLKYQNGAAAGCLVKRKVPGSPEGTASTNSDHGKWEPRNQILWKISFAFTS